MDWLLAGTPYHSPYFAEKMSRTRKRTTIPTSWDSNQYPGLMLTPTRKAKNGKLLSGTHEHREQGSQL